MSVLARIGGVGRDYRHVTKIIRPASTLVVDGAELKWYDIAPTGAPIRGDIHELARRDLGEAASSGALELSDDLGFVILHRCGLSFYFLLVSTWRNANELWETVWAKDDGDPRFHLWPVEGTHRPTFCVWELGAVCHEQQAWSRYLRSPRDAAAREAYLADTHSGPV